MTRMSKVKLRALAKRILPRVRRRLEGAFEEDIKALSQLSPADLAAHLDSFSYMYAKQRAAQNREFAPLLKSLARRMGDPELAKIAAELPPRSPLSKSEARANLAVSKRALGRGVRDIRKIIKEETGMARVPRELTVIISAELLDCTQPEIKKIIDGK
jgi:hypothetical protein